MYIDTRIIRKITNGTPENSIKMKIEQFHPTEEKYDWKS